MMKQYKCCLFITGLLCFAVVACVAQSTYTLQTKRVVVTVPKALWGLFFEDINRAADGGLYAEMVENRSFDFPKPMTAWETWPKPRLRDGIFMVMNQSAENAADPKYMRVTTNSRDTVGLMNSGFDEGMAFKRGLSYDLTLRYRQKAASIHCQAFIFNGRNRVIGHVDIALVAPKDGDWHNQRVSVVAGDTASGGKLLLIFEGKGQLDVDRISLFPTDTWKQRPGGLRADLVKKLYELHPGFLRFPGGCIVEGNQILHRYQWKHTIGNLEDRQQVQNIWADNLPGRPAPDYMESFGLGFFEYFQLCEDIGAEPLPIINVGMSCQFDAAEVVPVNELEPYITDALDLVEFANGDTSTYWGRKRAQLGHPAPFNMQMLGVGNENWGPQYAEHLAIFTKRLKSKYPGIKLVNASGYGGDKQVFGYMDSVLRSRKADIIDEHFYDSPQWFMANAGRYDHYDRKGPKIFVGEYAAQSDRVGSVNNKNTLLTALSEACFMTGIERNADVVAMASYAPLFAHVRGWQWTPNLIWFNNEISYVTPNYWVQYLFSNNKGTQVVPLLQNGNAVEGQDSTWASAVVDQAKHELVIKLVNMSGRSMQKYIKIDVAVSESSVTTLTGANTGLENTLGYPDQIKPETTPLTVKGRNIEFTAKPYSLNVLRMQLK